jgi:ribonuclease P protein component
MINRSHRFHGYGSLRRVYQSGATTRGPLFALKTSLNSSRRHYRLAVVVSRKVEKSAVARNRIRRRLYAAVRELSGNITEPYDIVLTVFSKDVLDQPAKELAGQVKLQLQNAGVLASQKPSQG